MEKSLVAQESPLIQFVLRGLERCFMPEQGMWSFRYWLDGRDEPNQSVRAYDLFYSMNVLLGFSHVPGAFASYGRSPEQFYLQIASQFGKSDVRHYAYGMALWAAAELDVEVPPEVLDRVRALTANMQEVEATWMDQDIGLMLSGLVAQCRAHPDLEPIARKFRDLALGSMRGPHNLFFASAVGPRRHFSSFATQVYLTLGLYHYGAFADDASALAAADACVRKLLTLQGPHGEWPWFYNSTTGRVVDFYEVYSVHQHGMAPAILHHAVQRSVPGARDALSKGFHWILGENEMRRSMLRPDLQLIHRSQARAGYLGSRAARATRAMLNTLLGRSDHILDRGGSGLIITPEVRSYELGWTLWSFGGRRDYPELTHRGEFAAAIAMVQPNAV